MRKRPADFFPYPSLRPGQGEMMKSVYDSIAEGKMLILEAPNGLGKTVSVLSAALALAREEKKRVLYLARTHKQMDRAMDELKEISKLHPVRGMVFRGRKETCLNDRLRGVPISTPRAASEACKALRARNLCPFYDRTANLREERFKRLIERPLRAREFFDACRREGKCPYETAKECMKFAEVIGMSYLYALSEELRVKILERSGIGLKETVLVMDECHNLPRISLDIMNCWMGENVVKRAVAEQMAFFGEYDQFSSSLLSIMGRYGGLEHSEVVIGGDSVLDELFLGHGGSTQIQKLKEMGEIILDYKTSAGSHPISYTSMVEDFLRKLIECGHRDDFLIVMRTDPVSLGLLALDPRVSLSNLSKERLSAVLMSGTVGSPGALAEEIGIKEFSSASVLLPYGDSGVEVCLATGVTTATSSRSPSRYRAMAEVVGELSKEVKGNLGVFAASYEVLKGLLKAGVEEVVERPVFIEREGSRSSTNDEMIGEYKDWASLGGAVLLGVQGGRNSVDGLEPILLRSPEDGIKIVRIVPFIDSLLQEGEEKKRVNHLGFEVASFDADYNIVFKPIKCVIRHPDSRLLYELTLETGRHVRVTPDHSVFALREDGIIPVRVETLRVGDFLVIPMALPRAENRIHAIDLVRELSKHRSKERIRIWGPEDCLRGQSGSNRGDWGQKCGYHSAPLTLLEDPATRKPLTAITDRCYLHHEHGRILIPTRIDVTAELMRLLGYYVAEGCIRKTRGKDAAHLSFGVDQRERIGDAKGCVRKVFGIQPVERLIGPTTVNVAFGDELVAIVLRDILEAGNEASDKRVPPIVFNVGPKLQLEFIKGLYRSDGPSYPRRIELKVKEARSLLASDLLFLFLQIGVPTSLVIEKGHCWLHVPKTYSSCAIPTRVDGTGCSQGFSDSPTAGLRDPRNLEELPREPPTHALQEPYRQARSDAPEDGVVFGARVERGDLGRKPFLEAIDYMTKEARRPFTERKAQLWRRIARGQLCFVRVRRIRRVPSSSRYVYDVSVPGVENFVGGFGGIVFHNSEGEDYPGEEMAAVVVLGMPFARPTDSMKARISFYERIFPRRGKYYAYVLPAIRTAAQAAGRPIRGPKDDAFIVLADNRFLSNEVIAGFPCWMRRRAKRVPWRDVPHLAKGFFERRSAGTDRIARRHQ